MSSTVIHTSGGVEARLDHLAHQLDELTEHMRRQQAHRAVVEELLGELTQLSGPAMASVTDRLQAAEQHGYLDFARSSLGVVDRIVTNFDEEDVTALGDNVVLILETVREMTQPEIMTMLRRTAHLVNEPGAVPAEPPSLFALLREMRDPQVRVGLARMLGLLRSLGVPPPDTTTASTPAHEEA